MYFRRSFSQSIPHLRSTSIFDTSPIYTRPNEESHDGNGTCTKEEEKGRYTEGIAQIPDDDNNLMVRYEGARLEQRWNIEQHLYFWVNEDFKGSSAWWPRLKRNLCFGASKDDSLDGWAWHDSTHGWSLRWPGHVGGMRYICTSLQLTWTGPVLLKI